MSNAMIWGASGGIGRALTELLVDEGWRVVAASRHPDDLAGVTEHRVEVDVADPFAVQRAMREATMDIDDLALNIYSAGDITSAKVEQMAPDAWRRILDANLNGAFHVAHNVLPYMAEGGHMVFLGAVSERLRLPGLGAYAAAKSGLEAFGDALRKEARKQRVTVVRPGAVRTGLWDKVPMDVPDDAAPPQKVVERILGAYREEHSGTLDLT